MDYLTCLANSYVNGRNTIWTSDWKAWSLAMGFGIQLHLPAGSIGTSGQHCHAFREVPCNEWGPLAVHWASPTHLELSIARLAIGHALEAAPMAGGDLCGHCPMWPADAHSSKGSWSTQSPFEVDRYWSYRHSTQPHAGPALTKGVFSCAWLYLVSRWSEMPLSICGRGVHRS